MAAQVELVTDTNSLKNQAGDKVWVVCAIILGKQEQHMDSWYDKDESAIVWEQFSDIYRGHLGLSQLGWIHTHPLRPPNPSKLDIGMHWV